MLLKEKKKNILYHGKHILRIFVKVFISDVTCYRLNHDY